MNARRDTDGRYSYDMAAICKCGHTLGMHLAAGPVKQRACIAHECDGGPDRPCECAGFRKYRVQS